MPIEVEVPDVGTVEFPDNMSESDITSALNKQYAKPPSITLSPYEEAKLKGADEGMFAGGPAAREERMREAGDIYASMLRAPVSTQGEITPFDVMAGLGPLKAAMQRPETAPIAKVAAVPVEFAASQATPANALLAGLGANPALAPFVKAAFLGMGIKGAMESGIRAQETKAPEDIAAAILAQGIAPLVMAAPIPKARPPIIEAARPILPEAAKAAEESGELLSPEGYRLSETPGVFESDLPPPPEAYNITTIRVGRKVTYRFRLPAAKAVEETPTAKGVPSATQERIIEESRQPEYIGTDAQRLSAETGGGNRPEPTAQISTQEIPSAAPGQERVLLSETGLRPAIKLMGDKPPVVGEAGQTHNQIIEANKIAPRDIDQRGFVDPQGNFLARETAAATTGLPTATEPGRLHSTDLPEAKEPPAAAIAQWPWPEKSQWTLQRLRQITPEERANRSKFLGLKKADGSWETAPAKIAEVAQKRFSEKPAPLVKPTTEEPLYAGLPMPKVLERIDRNLKVTREALATKIRSAPNRRVMDQTMDATDNMAAIAGRKSGNSLRIGSTPIEREAAYAMIEANGDAAAPATFIAKASGRDEHAVEVAAYLQAHWNDPRIQQLAIRGRQLLDQQIHQEEAAGINTEYREAYVPHLLDQEKFMGAGKPYVIGGNRGGIATGFKKGRTYNTIYDDIEAGLPVKTMDIADAVEHRVKVGQKLINRVEWADSLRGIVDPTDNRSIVTSLVKHQRSEGKPAWESAPMGYAVREIVPGMRVAVHEGYTSLWDALTGTSKVAATMAGKMILETEGALKHSLLLFDTFHVSRIFQKQIALTPKAAGYTKGLSLLEYSLADLNRAVASGEITPDIANYIRANRADANLLLKSGLNVGRIQENLYNSVVRDIPIIGTFNKWVFEKMSRGAMMQSALIELGRIQRQFGLSREEAAMKVARELNAYFGNIGRQGIFKSQSARDVASIVGLAPQWVESMLRTEIGSVGKAVIDPIRYRKLAVSSIPLGVGTALAAYFVGTQLLNMATRGHPTWENPEKGHKLDAWIPDVTGKSAGFFLSPFSVAAEVTHDMIRYIRSEPDAVSAAFRILGNKASPLTRALFVLGTGQTWDQGKVVGAWNKAKAAAINLVPAPIGIAPLIKGQQYPGQAQRQLTASMGIKTEPAPTPRQEMFEIVRDWGLNNPDPKIREQFERRQKEQFAKSAYDPLRKALVLEPSKAANEVLKLRQAGKSQAQIIAAFRPRPFSGSLRNEALFVRTLKPEQRAIYQQAKKDQMDLYRKAIAAMREARGIAMRK